MEGGVKGQYLTETISLLSLHSFLFFIHVLLPINNFVLFQGIKRSKRNKRKRNLIEEGNGEEESEELGSTMELRPEKCVISIVVCGEIFIFDYLLVIVMLEEKGKS